MVFLKNIKAKGFKSFADETNIEFNRGLTAVVGPNGSGKSNIIDAVRFVLGETSAKTIRGAKMEDVIFNGTTERSKQNSAHVTLKIDNTDKQIEHETDEVNITRELFRNGDSEYYINNERVKLKDITELFLDSGLGKHAYNIISQGEVEAILNKKPESRREVIEEAAGVMKYKSRKKEASRKLDDTLLNLSRLHDITSELSTRVEQLEKESSIAEEYLALVEEMKQSDIEVTVYDTLNLLESFEEINKAYSDKSRQEENARHNVQLLDVSIENARDKREQLSQEERKNHEQYVELLQEKEQVLGKIELFKERKTSKNTLSQELLEEKETVTNKKLALQSSVKHVESSLKKLDDEIDEKNRQIEYYNHSKHELSNAQNENLEALKNDYYELMVEKTSVENRLVDMKKAEDRDSKKREELTTRLTDLNTSLNTLKTDNKNLKEKIHNHESTLASKTKTYENLNQQLDKEQKKYDALNQNYQKAQNFLTKLESKIDMYTNMETNYEGYYQGVKAILKEKSKLPGVLGSVLELVSIDEEYMTAFDTALGSNGQSIVTKREQDAKRAIAYLKDKKLGFATFLPLDTVRPRNLREDAKYKLENSKIPNSLLSALVKTDEPKLLSHLFNTTVIVNNHSDGSILAKELNYSVRIVTKTGEIFNPGGAVSGGSRGKGNAVLNIQKEKAELTKKLATYKQETHRLKTDIETTQEKIETLIVNTRQTENSIQELKNTLNEFNQHFDKTDYQKETLEERIVILQQELADVQSTKNERELEALLNDKQNELERLREHIDLVEKEQNHIDGMMENNESKKQEVLEARASLSATRKHEQAKLQDLNSRLAVETSNIDDVDERLNILQNESSYLDIDTLNNRHDELNRLITQLSEESQYLKKEISELGVVYKKDIEDRQENLTKIEQLEQELRSLHGQKEKTESRLNMKVDYLSDTYTMTFEKAKAEYTDLNNIEDKRERIRLNKKSIEELGNVNLNSIEEFKTVNERYSFLKHEEDDLLAARETLLEVINEMDNEVSVRFKETFLQVNEKFKEVFFKMFGGGEAELRLTEEEHYLNAGLLIYAEPPGKNLTNMSLLSGGERALTAISLLFSILEVKDSPFIILDEVEAALDEANVIRFADYLRMLSAESQFIVITHRKGTMEKSDRLFGVTMQERGISELISVDLKSYVEPKREDVY